MKKIMNVLLRGTSSLALLLALTSIAQASTLFTHQPLVDESLNEQLNALK